MEKVLSFIETAEHKAKLSEVSNQIFQNFLNVLPSNYSSEVEGPFYTLQFRALSDFFAELQVSAEILCSETIFDFTRVDLIQSLFGDLIFPEGTALIIKNVTEYKDFLKKFLTYILQGSRQESLQQASSLVSGNSFVDIVDRVPLNVEDSFFLDIYLSSADKKSFPDNLFILRSNIDLILNALKPAHLAYEYQNLFAEKVTLFDSDNSLFTSNNAFEFKGYNLTFNLQQDMRKNYSGTQYITGRGAYGGSKSNGDFYTFRDPEAILSYVLPGAKLLLEEESGIKEYIVDKVIDEHTLRIRTWFYPDVREANYKVELDLLGVQAPRQVLDEVLLVTNGIARTLSGPLVKHSGDGRLATLDDVVSSSPLSKVDPYTGTLTVQDTSVKQIVVSYYWTPNPFLPMGGLNSGGFVLNRYGEKSGPISNYNKFAFKTGLNRVVRNQPRIYSPRYFGTLKEGSAALNNKNKFTLNRDLKLGQRNFGSSGEFYSGFRLKSSKVTAVNGIIDLKNIGMTVADVRYIRDSSDITVSGWLFLRTDQKIKNLINNNTYTVFYTPDLPVTPTFIQNQPLDESETLLFDGAVPFFDADEFVKLSKLDKDNGELPNTLLTSFSDGLISSEGFVGLELEDGAFREPGEQEIASHPDITILHPEISYKPVYLWGNSLGSGDSVVSVGQQPPLLNQKIGMGININQSRLWGAGSQINTLSKYTGPTLPQVKMELLVEGAVPYGADPVFSFPIS
jgi:hypothetical protein